ncbi:MAG: hypothetical protein RI967_449, partial [Planctomycetota bacterium]
MTPGSPQFHSFAAVGFAPLSRCLRELAARLAAVAEPAPGAFARVESTVDGVGIDLLEWLRGAPAGARRYFRDRSGRVEVAGVGVAASAESGAHETLRQEGGASPAVWFLAQPFDAARARE